MANNQHKWTDELIASELMRISNLYEPPRMPSHAEMIEHYGNYSLTCAVQKRGGTYQWAKRLGLERKNSETKLGIMGEEHIAMIINDLGHTTELTNTAFPYDILVDGCVKVDVKTSNTSIVRGSKVHAYRLGKKIHTCDFYVFYEADTGRQFVIPAHVLYGQIMVEMGETTRYQKYQNAYHLISDASRFYKDLCNHTNVEKRGQQWE